MPLSVGTGVAVIPGGGAELFVAKVIEPTTVGVPANADMGKRQSVTAVVNWDINFSMISFLYIVKTRVKLDDNIKIYKKQYLRYCL